MSRRPCSSARVVARVSRRRSLRRRAPAKRVVRLADGLIVDDRWLRAVRAAGAVATRARSRHEHRAV